MGVTTWYSERDELRSGTGSVPNPNNEKSESLHTTLLIDKALSPRWGALLALPYISNEVSFSGTSQEAKGLGDAALYLKYTVWQSWVNSTREVQLIAGVDSETGGTKEKDAQGNLLPATEQPGSNSTDLIVGAALNWGFIGFITHADVTYKMNGTAGYEFGDVVAANAGINVPLKSKKWSFSGEINSEFRQRDISSRPGAGVRTDKKVVNSGGETVYLTPGIQWQPRESWVINAGVQIPVYQNFRGTQLAAKHNYVLSFYRRFSR